MQKLTYVLFQLNEAARYMGGRRLEQLRLALLLLDNAAEVQLDARARQELGHEELREAIRSSALRIPGAERPDHLGELTDWKPLSKAQKRELEKYFDAKLRFLSERHGILDGRLARVLSYLHRYRNEAYHHARVRPETIRTAAAILFEADCALLLEVYQVSYHSSAEDYSWLQDRFGIGRAIIDEPSLQRVVDDLRSLVVPTLRTVAKTLTAHLRSRIREIWDDLDFVVESTRIPDRATALKVAQLGPLVQRHEIDPRRDDDLRAYEAPWTIQRVRALNPPIAAIGLATDRLDAFARFSLIEAELEPLETQVRELSTHVDRWIQFEVDRARGK